MFVSVLSSRCLVCTHIGTSCEPCLYRVGTPPARLRIQRSISMAAQMTLFFSIRIGDGRSSGSADRANSTFWPKWRGY